MHSALICTSMTFGDLAKKQVVNVCDGKLLGNVCDMDVDVCSGDVRALILNGSGLFASLSAKNRITIPWRDIERIGEDAILVRYIARADEDKKS